MTEAKKKTAAFGLLALQICKLISDPKDGVATYDPNWIDLYIQEIAIGKSVNRIKEKGNEKILNIEPMVDSYSLTFSNAQIPFSALALINGNLLGVNTQGQTVLRENGEDVAAQFALRAITKKTFDGGGPLGIYIPKATGILTVSPKSGDFANCSFEGEFMPRESDDKTICYIELAQGKGIEAVTDEATTITSQVEPTE